MFNLRRFFGRAKETAEERGVTPEELKEDAKEVADAVKHEEGVTGKAKGAAEAAKDAAKRHT
jgi:hypothetical protein